jgi:Transposase IS116/IS110/IS902 family
MHRTIVQSGWQRSANPACIAARSSTTNSWMRCGPCVRQQVRRELLGESQKHPAWKLLCQIPSIGPIRAAVLIGILQTPHRFRTKRQLWTFSGFGIETHSSADYRSVEGQLRRAQKQVSIRGLNTNHNHDLKNLFKGTAIVAASKPGPFQEFYVALLAKGIRLDMARLTLARKIAAITLHIWKKGVRFDAPEITSSLSVSDRVRSIPGIFSGGGRRVLETLGFESESQLIS